ncbi:MAG: hypothetical protein M3Z46_03195 [Actinomycetota bacterium]|nr:hypothetical protein [Actinomycetota bacterium]
MTEPEGRANHQHGSLSFLVTKWRAVIGPERFTMGLLWPTLRTVRR